VLVAVLCELYVAAAVSSYRPNEYGEYDHDSWEEDDGSRQGWKEVVSPAVTPVPTAAAVAVGVHIGRWWFRRQGSLPVLLGLGARRVAPVVARPEPPRIRTWRLPPSGSSEAVDSWCSPHVITWVPLPRGVTVTWRSRSMPRYMVPPACSPPRRLPLLPSLRVTIRYRGSQLLCSPPTPLPRHRPLVFPRRRLPLGENAFLNRPLVHSRTNGASDPLGSGAPRPRIYRGRSGSPVRPSRVPSRKSRTPSWLA
jgi:hypothetical protein